MSYLVLARKLRPTKFSDLIGQEAIAQTLINAIEKDRVAHAFLFTGPRGVGKTSCARILTKALNCLNPQKFEPCNECENCDEINKNISTDIVEIDAASNRGIEHIRELRENIKFSPSKCKIKTYIIDEVHMLTTESFNALLKTLEEPPAHVKFILATTDPHKVPTTVLSRCQRYDFSLIPPVRLQSYLSEISKKEGLDIEEEGLRIIAEHAQGGLRDSLTALDMVISFSRGHVSAEDVSRILGVTNQQDVIKFSSAIIDQDLNQVLSAYHSIIQKGYPISSLIGDLLKELKNISLAQNIPRDAIVWSTTTQEKIEFYYDAAKSTRSDFLQKCYHIILESEQQVRRSEFGSICMEMNLVKICQISSIADISKLLQSLDKIKPDSEDALKEIPNTNVEPVVLPVKEIDIVLSPETVVNEPSERNVISQIEKKEANVDREVSSHISVLLENKSTSLISDVSAKELENTSKQTVKILQENRVEEQPIIEEEPIIEEYNIPSPPYEEEIIEKETLVPVREKKPTLDVVDQKEEVVSPSSSKELVPSSIVNTDKQYNWAWFVEKLSEELPKPMISILRNLKTLQFDEDKLVIESPNATLIDLIPKEKKLLMEGIAKRIYKESFKLSFQVGQKSTGSSIVQKEQIKKEENFQLKKQDALDDELVKSIQKVFPDSIIKDVIVSEEN